MTIDPVEYRPSKPLGLSLAGVWVITGAVLVWLGSILGPDSVEAMDGLTRLLFTAVPIRLFAWTMAAVLAAIGLATARVAVRPVPSLIISSDGLRVRSQPSVPWSRVRSANLTSSGVLLIEMERGEVAPGREQRLPLVALLPLRRDPNKIALSNFELGADPGQVAAEIQERMEAWSRRSRDEGED